MQRVFTELVVAVRKSEYDLSSASIKYVETQKLEELANEIKQICEKHGFKFVGVMPAITLLPVRRFDDEDYTMDGQLITREENDEDYD